MSTVLSDIDAETIVALAESPEGLGLSDLARTTGRSVSSEQRSVARLVGARVIVRADRRYRLAPDAPQEALHSVAAWTVSDRLSRLRAAARQEALRTAFRRALDDPPTARRLRDIARRYLWWQPPLTSLRRPERLVAQVMTDGTWEDSELLLGVVGEAGFAAVLDAPPPGVFDRRAWAYWHARLGRKVVPPLPRRSIA